MKRLAGHPVCFTDRASYSQSANVAFSQYYDTNIHQYWFCRQPGFQDKKTEGTGSSGSENSAEVVTPPQTKNFDNSNAPKSILKNDSTELRKADEVHTFSFSSLELTSFQT